MEDKKTARFSDLGLSSELLRAITDMGFEEPTPIQAKTIPVLLRGVDLIGQAQTGTGKTAAYGIPVAEKTEARTFICQALILTPTRELAIQVAEEMNKIGKHKRLQAVPIYGGQSIERQINALRKGAQIVVGTPGRLLDHLSRKTLRLDGIKTVVLDEADEMLDMGFIDDITKILEAMPTARQTLLFSATMQPGVLKVANRFMRKPETISIARDSLTAPKINQIFYEVRPTEKMDALCRLIDAEDSDLFLVFCHTRMEASDVAGELKLKGYEAEAIHGEFTQSHREAVMKRFRDGRISVLVATDVAARGIDISNITHVINYSIPQNPESYVHRIGRTGRAGKAGIAITFVTAREDKLLRQMQSAAKTRITRGKLPSHEEIREVRISRLKEKIDEFMDDKRFDYYLEAAKKLSADLSAETLNAALLKFLMEGYGAPAQEAAIEEAAPGAMAKLFVTVGRAHKINAGTIVRLIVEKAGLASKDMGNIKISDKFTFVEVPRESAGKVIEALQRTVFFGKKISASHAKPPARR